MADPAMAAARDEAERLGVIVGSDVDRVEDALLAELPAPAHDKRLGVYACPVHGEVWRYLGPEDAECVHCLRASA